MVTVRKQPQRACNRSLNFVPQHNTLARAAMLFPRSSNLNLDILDVDDADNCRDRPAFRDKLE